MTFSGVQAIDDALGDLGELLAELGASAELCIAGGAAFLLQEPDRFHSTMDIDVAARVLPDRSLTAVDAIPSNVQQAVVHVARLRGLNDGW